MFDPSSSTSIGSSLRPMRRRLAQADFVGFAVTDDGDVVETAERALGLLQGLARDVDQMHARVPPGGLQRLGEDDNLLPAAAAQLDDQRLAFVVG